MPTLAALPGANPIKVLYRAQDGGPPGGDAAADPPGSCKGEGKAAEPVDGEALQAELQQLQEK